MGFGLFVLWILCRRFLEVDAGFVFLIVGWPCLSFVELFLKVLLVVFQLRVGVEFVF